MRYVNVNVDGKWNHEVVTDEEEKQILAETFAKNFAIAKKINRDAKDLSDVEKAALSSTLMTNVYYNIETFARKRLVFDD